MSIRTKVIGAFCAILVLFGAVSSYTYLKSSRVNQRLSLVSDLFLPLSRQMMQIQVGAQNLSEEMVRYYSGDESTSDRSTFSRMARDLYPYAIRKKFLLSEQLLLKFSETNHEPIAQLLQMLNDLRGRFEALPAAQNKQQFQEQFALFRSAHQVLSKKIDEECEKVTNEAQARGKETLITSVSLSLFLTLTGFFCMILVYRVLNPLPQLIQSLKRLTSGDFDQTIKVKSSDKDEIGQLAREFNRMLGALKERDQKIKTQQSELLQSEKLAAIGQLSAEVVHEIRNPLNSMNLNIDWLESELQSSNLEIKKTLKSISREIARLTQITESYLVRARVKTHENLTTEVNSLLREIIDFERGDKSGVEIEAELNSNEIYIHSDRSKIKQAFINVLKNAKEAMPKGGKILIKTCIAGDSTQVIFKDSGLGMTEETKLKSFLPFFTTKPNGTGLGLALTKEIVEAAKGRILVASQMGMGTTFTFQFPT
ncbi:MAG: sensor histidine kinase [Proteobacteria bacterium]|nr:sensor histidine kinase [Pseudomonadota bacterium]NBY19716.1 sensor histidine kinase [bacterium]